MSLKDPALDYRKQSISAPTYRYSRVVQNTGGTGVLLSDTSVSESVFDLSTKCRSLSRSYLSFDINLPAAVGARNHVHTIGAAWLDQIELNTRAGDNIVRVNNANVFYRAMAPYTTKRDKMKSADPVKADAVSEATRTTSMNSMVCRNNTRTLSSTATENLNSSCRLVDGVKEANSLIVDETQYVAAGGDAAATVVNVSIPLSEFKGTFLSLPQDSFFPEVMQLRLQWARLGQLGFTDTTAATGGTIAALAGATISNLYLYDSLEVDPEICNQLKSKVMSGMSMTIPYVHTYRENYSGGTYNRQLKFNATHGKNLLRIVHCNTDTSETGATFGQLDNKTVGGVGSKVASFYTNLDGLRLQDVDVRSGSHADDYHFMKHQIEGSCVADRSIYNHNRIWSDDFTGQRLCDSAETDDVENGLPLSGPERIWAINQTNNGAQTGVSYVFAITQKVLQQSGGQVLIV
jgi:hypothetical protein